MTCHAIDYSARDSSLYNFRIGPTCEWHKFHVSLFLWIVYAIPILSDVAKRG